MEDLFAQKGILADVDTAMAELQTVARKYGLAMGKRDMIYNSRLAQELGLWAQSEGRGHAFHIQAFEAYFVRGENLALDPVLLDIVEASGLDRDQGKGVLDQRRFSAEVDRDWELSRARGVAAAPTFFMGLDRLVGAQPYEALERMVLKYMD